MYTRFNFDSTGASVAAIILTPGFLMMAVAFIGFNSRTRLTLALAIGLGAVAIIWFALARGTYVVIDSDRDIYRTSGFFISKVIPLSSIDSLTPRGTFLGLMTNVHLTYRNNDGRLRTMSTMNIQSFKKGDFKKFLEALRLANPKMKTPQELLK